jgi:multisubunit Na+/H+ antiporter MnhF subunit
METGDITMKSTAVSVSTVLQLLIGLLALAAALFGVIRPAIYEGVVSPGIAPGVFAQDILVTVAAVLLLVLTATTGPSMLRRQIMILGILGFLLYAYGIYAIEQLYNYLYPVYLAIVALSFYALIYVLGGISASAENRIVLPSWLRYISSMRPRIRVDYGCISCSRGCFWYWLSSIWRS